jgi:NAD(P)H-dependent FMN reductase
MMIKLKIITASTRPGRRGIAVTHWVLDMLKSNSAFHSEHLDLAEINLPFMDEPHHPRLQNYTKQHTKDWSQKIAEADAFIIVMPEYNNGYIAPLKNAIDFLVNEWAYKSVGFVSYGGVSAGTRAVQLLKPVLSLLRMLPVTESVYIPFFESHLKEGVFVPSELLNKNLNGMFSEISKVDRGLRLLRGSQD